MGAVRAVCRANAEVVQLSWRTRLPRLPVHEVRGRGPGFLGGGLSFDTTQSRVGPRARTKCALAAVGNFSDSRGAPPLARVRFCLDRRQGPLPVLREGSHHRRHPH